MSRIIRIYETGGPDVFKIEQAEEGEPGPGQVRLRQTAVGINYIDTYMRSGLYPTSLPAVLGSEAAGVVEKLGANVDELAVGDRVAYALQTGAYAEARLIDADRLVKLPTNIDDRTAAAIMLKGLTTQYLLRRTYCVKVGDVVLVHAAAGGVGLLACQWASSLGAIVIGTVSSPEKAELARAHGCTHVILYTRENFVDRIRELTRGHGVDVVYDSVGRDTFARSLECLRVRGLLVSFGQSSGAIEPFSPSALAKHGSLYLTRPTLAHYIGTRAELTSAATELFDMVARGELRVEIGQVYGLGEVDEAHRALETRQTVGSTILLP